MKWEQVERELQDCGMGLAEAAIAACHRAGTTPSQVMGVIRFWRRWRGAWKLNVGDLWRRTKSLRPGDFGEQLPFPTRKVASMWRRADYVQSVDSSTSLTPISGSHEPSKALGDVGSVHPWVTQTTSNVLACGRSSKNGLPTDVMRSPTLGRVPNCASRVSSEPSAKRTRSETSI